ncbi:GIY-YIG nuclease family protein [Candidatus Babeliales bacterium]|nr:GIY-YIG nuclease family protein [Candidatus Babeliales bacterium]
MLQTKTIKIFYQISILLIKLNEHNSGISKHSTKFKPWKIIFYSAFETQEQAIYFEKYLKSCSGRTFMKKHCNLKQ